MSRWKWGCSVPWALAQFLMGTADSGRKALHQGHAVPAFNRLEGDADMKKCLAASR